MHECDIVKVFIATSEKHGTTFHSVHTQALWPRHASAWQSSGTVKTSMMIIERLASHHAASTCPRHTRGAGSSACTQRVSVAPRRSLRVQCSATSSNGNGVSSSSAGLVAPSEVPATSSSSSNSAPIDNDSNGKYLAVGCQPCMDGTLSVNIDENRVVTKFIAETLLPTKHGKFRLRGYKHSVGPGCCCVPQARVCQALGARLLMHHLLAPAHPGRRGSHVH